MTDQPQKDSPARAEEQARLDAVQARLDEVVKGVERRVLAYNKDVKDQTDYMWQHRREMDFAEKIASRQSREQSALVGTALAEQRLRLLKIKRSPWFGRFDFAAEGDNEAKPFYIGVHHFHDDEADKTLVHDWRAPVATLFYDYETGPGRYVTPEGEVDGTIERKRQFRIRYHDIELMIDSSVNVVDDVLIETLNETSDEHMREIVATIQRDQNAIIRNEEAQVLIIQGVAGSGKTSIALHRIAFLLYRFRDTLSADDILIISPNRVFSEYIANVLPELGEEEVREIGMEDVADALLEGQYKFQSFFGQTEALLGGNDEALKQRIEFKADPEFLRQLRRYAEHVEKTRFRADDLWVARRLVPGFLMAEVFAKHKRMNMTERTAQTAREINRKVALEYNYELNPDEQRKLLEGIRDRVTEQTLRRAYQGFYDWIGRPELFRPAGGRLEYADVFPLIYLKMQLEGIRSPYRQIKHLLIDEMQDYTPVQYAVISKLFDCRMTILGDAWQSVNPYSASTAELIQDAFGRATRVALNKTFRSTCEIARFAQRISPNPDLEVVERHGPEPEVLECSSRPKEVAAIVERIEEFQASDHNTLAIICKTRGDSKRLHKSLAKQIDDLHLIDELSAGLSSGVVVMSAHLAKGLEFDRVIVPQATADNYRDAMDRNLLYVACTRAMHRLALTHVGPVTELIG
ncbi:MAG: 3'-5' exonuclease [Xanthomonadales bacterium]|nr:3'-5' exonuclease [Xanthomonadales bacterium]